MHTIQQSNKHNYGTLPGKPVLFINLFKRFAVLGVTVALVWPRTALAWKIETVMGITVEGGSGSSLSSFVGQLLNILYSMAGASALVMVFLGAYKYISSSGDPKKAQEGKEIIRSAVYGLVLILIAFLLAQTLGDFFGDKTTFTEPTV